MKRISKDKAIEIILSDMDKGKTYSDSLSDFCGRFQLTSRTFDNYWMECLKTHKKQKEAIQEQLKETKVQLAKDELNKLYSDKNHHTEGLYKNLSFIQSRIVFLRGLIEQRETEDSEEVEVLRLQDIASIEMRINSYIAEERAIRKQIGDWYDFNSQLTGDTNIIWNETKTYVTDK